MRSLLFGEEIKVNVIGGSGVMSVDAPISHWSVCTYKWSGGAGYKPFLLPTALLANCVIP